MSYEVGAIASLRAMHVMPVEGPEGGLHAHDYRVEVVASRSRLDTRAMVVDLDVLREHLASILEPLRDADLGQIASVEAQGVTVEVFARWVHDALAHRLAGEGAESLGVRVWESETEFAGYTADLRPGGGARTVD
jgi:6-pyruvoyltetrahydropterin/6-carboxytetrahydropterin synthase